MKSLKAIAEMFDMSVRTVRRRVDDMKSSGRYSDAIAQAGGKIWIDPEAFREFITGGKK